MKADLSRRTFSKSKHHSGVVMQQGRVVTDAEYNEQGDIDLHRARTTRRDVIGCCGGPMGVEGQDMAGFEITRSDTSLEISSGRYYVHGILCENEEAVALGGQKDLPDYKPFEALGLEGDEQQGTYLVYVEVWERLITPLEDEEIQEVALGGIDTAARKKVIWQVKLERVGDLGVAFDCHDLGPNWTPDGAQSNGKLAARSAEQEENENPCTLSPEAGYRRLENQLYRVQVHEKGKIGNGATYLWSRENGHIVTKWLEQTGQDSEELIVESTGRDRVLGFGSGDWVELTDDTRELYGRPGVLVRLLKVEGTKLTIDPSTIQDPDNPSADSVSKGHSSENPKVRRWESAGALDVDIPQENDGWLDLEDGVQVKFDDSDGDTLQTGDYWLIPARTALGDVIWPSIEQAGNKEPEFQGRHGIVRYYCPLAIAEWNGQQWSEPRDCRRLFPPLTNLPTGRAGCCTVTVGDGVHSAGDFQDIQAAADSLEGPGVVCLLPGEYRLKQPVKVEGKPVVIRGCGKQSPVIAPGGPAFVFSDVSDGIRLESLFIRSTGSPAAIAFHDCDGVHIEHCIVRNETLDLDEPAPPSVALFLRNCREVVLRDCFYFGLPAIAAQCEPLRLEGSTLRGGGVWIWEGSSRVTIETNDIGEGEGPGIVLGRFSVSSPGRKNLLADKEGVEEVLIQNNHIHGMGNSGIATPKDAEKDLRFGDVRDLTIRHNRIEGCGRAGPDDRFDNLAVGGVVLRNVEGLHIEGNTVRGNGGDAVPAVGVFLHGCSGVEIANNHVLDNGVVSVPEPLCVNFSEREAGEGRNPLEAKGFRFEVYSEENNLADYTKIVTWQGETPDQIMTGLHCGYQTRVTLPEASSRVTVKLCTYKYPAVVRVLGVAGNVLAEEKTDAGIKGTVTMEFTEAAMASVEITASGNDILLAEVCSGVVAAGFQAGVAIWYFLGSRSGNGEALRARSSGGTSRIHANVVSTPSGQALLAVGMGTLSVTDNVLAARGSYKQPAIGGTGKPDASDLYSQIGKCITVNNVGHTPVVGIRASSGDYSHYHVAMARMEFSGNLQSSVPSGSILFNNNQVYHEITEEHSRGTLIATYIESYDDVSVADNHLQVQGTGARLTSDLAVRSSTVRVINNRFVETLGSTVWSCHTQGNVMNNTSDNQANHCVEALGTNVIKEHNQVVFSTECDRLFAMIAEVDHFMLADV